MQSTKNKTTKLTSIGTALVLAILSLVSFQSNSAFAAAPKTVTFNANGGTGTIAPQTDNKPGTLTLNCTAPNTCAITKVGFSFSGWNSAADGSGTAYADGASYSFAADLTLYAQWTLIPVSHTVTFDANGGTGTMATQSASSSTALTPNTFTRSGYTFTNWNTAADASGTTYVDGANYSFASDQTLYAQWTALPTFTVMFDANGGTGTMVAQVDSGPANLNSNTFTNNGFSFIEWNEVADGSGKKYADGANYPFNADVTLYAQWNALPSHSVTFDANGGTGTMSAQVTNVSTALTSNSFTRAGYTFTSWNTAADGSGTSYGDGAIYTFGADLTLYAQWNLNGSGIPVDIAAITGLSNPLTGFLIYQTINETAQYTGTVSWSTNPLVFAPLTVYTATITLTPKSGYTLQGVAANFFTVVGASSTTNSADSGVITANFVATGPVISTVSKLNVGAVNPTIVLKGSGFKVGDLSADMNIAIDGSGLTVASVTGNSSEQVTINLNGTATAGFITIQAKTSAFAPETESPSNQIFLIFASSTSEAGSTVPVSIPLGGSTIDVIITLPTALKTGQNVELSVIAANDSAANFPVLTVDVTSNFYNFDKPLVIDMPDITAFATLAHSLVSGGYQLIPQISSLPGETFCSDQENDGYIDNGSTITIYTCHISEFGYRELQSPVTLSADKSSMTVGATAQLTAGGGSGTIAFTYASSTTSVCSVNASGVVTALTVGTCSVTANNPENGAYINRTSSAVSITVNAASSGGGGGGGGGTSTGGSGGISVTYLSQPSVSIASAESTIQLTKTTKLTITGGAGSGVVTYSTTTPEICSVTSEGVVTGLKAGTCNVRATKSASGTYLEANTPYITVTVSDSDKKAADEAAAKAAAEKLAADKAAADAAAAALTNDEAAAAAAAKAEADRLALLESQAAKAEAARQLILNKNQITWKKFKKIYKVNVNLAQKYAWELITIKVGSKLKGKVVYRTTDWLALNGGGDGVITQSKAPVKGSYYRIVLGKKVVYTQLIKQLTKYAKGYLVTKSYRGSLLLWNQVEHSSKRWSVSIHI